LGQSGGASTKSSNASRCAPIHSESALGTPPAQKRHVVFDSGHVDFPRSELIREVLGWLDKYLGPVHGPSASTQ
jgi:hypothetical protein